MGRQAHGYTHAEGVGRVVCRAGCNTCGLVPASPCTSTWGRHMARSVALSYCFEVIPPICISTASRPALGRSKSLARSSGYASLDSAMARTSSIHSCIVPYPLVLTKSCCMLCGRLDRASYGRAKATIFHLQEARDRAATRCRNAVLNSSWVCTRL